MAEGARKLLAMRAQQATAAAPGGSGSEDAVGGVLSPSASSVLSILSAVGKARAAAGAQEQVIFVLFLVCVVQLGVLWWYRRTARTKTCQDYSSNTTIGAVTFNSLGLCGLFVFFCNFLKAVY